MFSIFPPHTSFSFLFINLLHLLSSISSRVLMILFQREVKQLGYWIYAVLSLKADNISMEHLAVLPLPKSSPHIQVSPRTYLPFYFHHLMMQSLI